MFADENEDLDFDTTGINITIVSGNSRIPTNFKTKFCNSFVEASTDIYNDLFLNMKKSDVTFVIEETEVPAHRVVLSERSEYFRAMFSNSFIEARSDKVILKETNLKAFKRVLACIYTDKIKHLYKVAVPLDELYEVFACVRFYMIPLTLEDVSYLETEDPDALWLLLNNAITYSFDELIPLSVNRLQEKVSDIIKSKAFEDLSLQALKHVLEIGLNTSELNLFEALVGWMRSHPDCSSSFPELLKHISLYLFEKDQLDMLFKPTPLVKRKCIADLLSEQQIEATKFKKFQYQNIVNGTTNLRIVEGILDCRSNSVTPSQNRVVIFDLRQNYLLNYLKLENVTKNHFLYNVAVSMDMRYWKDINEGGKPNEYLFKDIVVRFIRIQALYNVGISIKADIEARYLPKLDMLPIVEQRTIESLKEKIESLKRLYEDNKL